MARRFTWRQLQLIQQGYSKDKAKQVLENELDEYNAAKYGGGWVGDVLMCAWCGDVANVHELAGHKHNDHYTCCDGHNP